jgi:oligopeptide transport system permease protein
MNQILALLSPVFRKLAEAATVLLVISALTFALVHGAPGGPFNNERSLDPQIVTNLESHFGLDQPGYIQYGRWLGKLVRGDLGPSYTQPDRTGNQIVAEGLPKSLVLGGVAFFLAIGVGVPIGLIGALWQNSSIDRGVVILTSLAISFPSFIVAAVLQWGVAFRLGWMPPAGWGDTWRQAVLPSMALALFPGAFVARLARASLLRASREDWMRTARAKGLGRLSALVRHGLRVALVPVVAYGAPLAASLLTGSFVVETIFAIPGLGRFFVTSVSDRDYTVVMAVTLVYAALLIALDVVADGVARLLDPRTSE